MSSFPWDAAWYIICFGIGALLIMSAPYLVAIVIGLVVRLIKNIFSKDDD